MSNKSKASPTLLSFLQETYVPRRLAGKSTNTVEHYRLTIRVLGRYLGREATLADLNDDTVSRFMVWRLAGVKSPHTAGKDLKQLRALANYAARKRLIPEFLEIQKPTLTRNPPQTWTVEQLQRLFAAAGQTSGTISGIPARVWWRALFLLAFETGERTGALLALKWEWVDLPAGIVRVDAECRKGRSKGAIYFIREHVASELVELRRHGKGELVFPRNRCIGSFYYQFKDVLRRAGLPDGRRFKLQNIRRAHASHLEANGGNATKSLQHSNRSVTEQSYLDPSLTDKERPSELLPVIK